MNYELLNNLNNWYCWVPNVNLKPKLEKYMLDDGIRLKISSINFNDFGKWICEISCIKPGETYRFCVEYLPENLSQETMSVSAMLSWKDASGRGINRDYVDNVVLLKDGWRRLHRTLDAPQKTDRLSVELWLRLSKEGSVSWRRPVFERVEPVKHRKVKVASTYIELFGKSPSENLNGMLNVIDMAGALKADFICLTEVCYSDSKADAQPVPGELTEIISEKARKYNSYIIFSMLERDGSKIFNTAILIDRKGNISGKYRKMHLPLAEAEGGISPGNEYGVFNTDFGKIGVMVCWDNSFPEAARILANRGTEIIFLPTQANDDIQQRTRAKDNGVFMVSSNYFHKGLSRIINPHGEVVSKVTSKKKGVAVAEIDLDERLYLPWLSVGCNGEAKSLFFKERRLDVYDPVSDQEIPTIL